MNGKCDLLGALSAQRVRGRETWLAALLRCLIGRSSKGRVAQRLNQQCRAQKGQCKAPSPRWLALVGTWYLTGLAVSVPSRGIGAALKRPRP
ncbi:hypothetical protein L209DRAFT_551818 [Thermothelomyces heterothallicus CBS 203.75]